MLQIDAPPVGYFWPRPWLPARCAGRKAAGATTSAWSTMATQQATTTEAAFGQRHGANDRLTLIDRVTP